MPHRPVEYPYKWEPIPEEEVVKSMRKPKRQYVRSIPDGIWMPKEFATIAESIYNLEIRSDDIWIVTYPKCGTTWTQEIIWHIVHNVDIETAKAVPHWLRTPFLEFECIMPNEAREFMRSKASDENRENIEATTGSSIALVERTASPRIIKSHLPVNLLPRTLFESGCKIIYVCRNPKDVCVSYYHHQGVWGDEFCENFQHFEQMFLDGTFMFGNYWNHVKTAWEYRDYPNLKIVWYEDMKKNLAQFIRETSKFIGYHLTEEKIMVLDNYLYIDNHRKHGPAAMANGIKEMEMKLTKFFRKGEVGDWKNYISGEKLKEWDEWIQKNLEGTEIEIPFEAN